MSHGSQEQRQGRTGLQRAWMVQGLLIAALLTGTAARLVAPDWDAGIAAHPDERFLLGAAEAVPLLGSVCRAVPDFAYGHFPVTLARLLVLVSSGNDPLVVARLFSGLVGVLLVALSAACGRQLAGRRGALFAVAVTALSPGLIQQGHFYTVDTIGAVLACGAVLAAARRRWRGAGVLSGLAVACKASLAISGVALLACTLLDACCRPPGCQGADVLGALTRSPRGRRIRRRVAGAGLRFAGPAVLAFLVASPWSLLTPVACWRGPWLQSMLVSGRYTFPYTQQYTGTLPFIYPLVQLGLWGLGPVAAGLGALGLVVGGLTARGVRLPRLRTPVVWGVIVFGATAALKVKFPRYLLPLYPWWAAWAGWLLWGRHGARRRRWQTAVAGLAVASTAVLGVAQVGLYASTHPWVDASRWLVAELPPGAAVVVEAWEHPLPVPLPENTTDGGIADLRQATLPIYDEASPTKLAALVSANAADALILASRRGYGALSREPARYAATLAWYEAALSGRSVHAFARCPRVGPLAITDDPLADAGLPVPVGLAERCGTRYALRLPRLDESFRVYDAPLTLVLTRPAE